MKRESSKDCAEILEILDWSGYDSTAANVCSCVSMSF